jgi:hypothetical protein
VDQKRSERSIEYRADRKRLLGEPGERWTRVGVTEIFVFIP